MQATRAGFVTYGNAYTTWGGRQFILVDDLFVREAYRGQGVARQLMATVEKLVIARGTYARWTVSPENERAIAFYKSLGARAIGIWIHQAPSHPDPRSQRSIECVAASVVAMG